MMAKTTRRKRLQMLHDLTKGDGCAEERKGQRYSEMMSETCSTAED